MPSGTPDSLPVYCASCNREVADEYYTLEGVAVCAECEPPAYADEGTGLDDLTAEVADLVGRRVFDQLKRELDRWKRTYAEAAASDADPRSPEYWRAHADGIESVKDLLDMIREEQWRFSNP